MMIMMVIMYDDVDGSYDDNGDGDDDGDDDEACSLHNHTCFVITIRVFVIAVREVSTYSII